MSLMPRVLYNLVNLRPFKDQPCSTPYVYFFPTFRRIDSLQFALPPKPGIQRSARLRHPSTVVCVSFSHPYTTHPRAENTAEGGDLLWHTIESWEQKDSKWVKAATVLYNYNTLHLCTVPETEDKYNHGNKNTVYTINVSNPENFYAITPHSIQFLPQYYTW